jgi:hypothetical protein
MTWSVNMPSWRNTTAFGWIWIKMSCGVAAVVKVCAREAERWSASVGSTVGLRTLNERINQVEQLVNTYHEQPIEEAPDVIQLDGIWLTLQQATGAVRSDKRNRRRQEKQGKRVVVLVALGFWQKADKQEILDWHIATSEGHTQWQWFLTRLQRRGVTAEKGRKRNHP